MVEYNREFWVTAFAVATFAGAGTLIRTALSLISLGDAPLIYSLIPNLVGTLILGYTKGSALSNKQLASGIGTGLCGSITTFSSFSYELNNLIVSEEPDYGWAVAFTAITFIGSALMFYMGECTAKYMKQSLTAKCSSSSDLETKERVDTQIEIAEAKPESEVAANMPVEVMGIVSNGDTGIQHVSNQSNSGDDVSVTYSASEKKETDPVTEKGRTDQKEKAEALPAPPSIACGMWTISFWVAVFLFVNALTIPLCFLVDNKLWLAAVFAPFGAFSRWYLGKLFNGRWSIPIGTLIANLFGSILLMTLLVAFHEPEDPLSETIWIEAVTKGFCGCLSTVSSFVGELFALKRKAKKAALGDGAEDSWVLTVMASKMSVLYFAITVVGAQLLDTIPNGIDVW